MKTRLLIFCLFLVAASYGQKKVLIEEYGKVVGRATEELDKAMKGPEGEIFLYKQESGITGIYDMDITIHNKGEVATVFVKNREGGSIQMQNHFKDFIKELEFNFKMPKGKDYKLSYSFNFNSY